MSREETIEKIRKLLALTETNANASENEVQQALLMVQKLLLKEGLSMEDIGEAEAEEIITESMMKPGNLNVWHRNLWRTLAAHFPVNPIINTNGHYKTYKVIGHKNDVEAYRLAAQFMIKAFESCWDRYYSKRKKDLRKSYSIQESRALKGTYCDGFASGLTTAFLKQETEFALVVTTPADVVDEMTKLCKGKSAAVNPFITMHDSDSYSHGYMDGKDSFTRRNLEGK